MMKKLLSLITVASFLVSLTSCLGDDTSTTVYYDDTAVTAFSLGTLNIQKHTTASDGVTDSTYTTTYSASSYAFYIDQLNQTIYNPDSLPYGTDVKHVVCTITTKNSGSAVLNLKSTQGADSLATYTSTDSLDFSSPVRIRVYNMNASAYREYTITVNVHQETGDELNWKSVSSSNLSAVSDRKLVANNGSLYLFGVQNGQTAVYKQTGSSWQQLDSNVQLDANAYRNVATKDNSLWVLNGSDILRSADGQNWSLVATGTTATQLLGASDAALYALTADGIAVSKDDDATWTADSLDDAATLLPSENITLLSIPSKTNEQTNDLILIGTRDGVTRIWHKVEENADNSQTQPWAFYADDEYNKLTLPALAHLQVIQYDNGLLALGGDFSAFYYSPDKGLTWTADSTYQLPTAFGLSASSFAMSVDSSNVIYITKASSADVWSGRLARTAWTTDQKAYTK
jgi:hypothetical protein